MLLMGRKRGDSHADVVCTSSSLLFTPLLMVVAGPEATVGGTVWGGDAGEVRWFKGADCGLSL